MGKMKEIPDFQFDEFKHLGVDFDSPEEVAQFDRKQGTSIERDNALLDRLGVGTEHVLVDLGCGTGHFACQVIAIGVKSKESSITRRVQGVVAG